MSEQNMVMKKCFPSAELFARDVEAFFDGFFRDFPKVDALKNIEGYPVTNIYTNSKGDYRLKIAVTDFEKDELDITIEDGCIIIRGEHKSEDAEWKLIGGRLKSSSFEKRYRLSNRLDTSKAVSELKNGQLIITIPAKEEIRPLKLKIQ